MEHNGYNYTYGYDGEGNRLWRTYSQRSVIKPPVDEGETTPTENPGNGDGNNGNGNGNNKDKEKNGNNGKGNDSTSMKDPVARLLLASTADIKLSSYNLTLAKNDNENNGNGNGNGNNSDDSSNGNSDNSNGNSGNSNTDNGNGNSDNSGNSGNSGNSDSNGNSNSGSNGNGNSGENGNSGNNGNGNSNSNNNGNGNNGNNGNDKENGNSKDKEDKDNNGKNKDKEDKSNNGNAYGKDKDKTNNGKHLGWYKNANNPNYVEGGYDLTNPEVFEVTNYINDLSEPISQVLMTTDVDGNYRGVYTYDNESEERISVEDLGHDEGVPNDPLYYLKDAQGTIASITNMNAEIIDSNRFAPYGEALDPVAKNARLTNSPFGYTGESHDIEGGLVYLRARYYEPDTMRFIQQDTVLGDIKEPLSRNLYAYANDNPLKFTDPTGHWAYSLRNGKCLAEVEKGDTLSGLSAYMLGNASRWKQIGYKGDPAKLQVGTLIDVTEIYKQNGCNFKYQKPSVSNSGKNNNTSKKNNLNNRVSKTGYGSGQDEDVFDYRPSISTLSNHDIVFNDQNIIWKYINENEYNMFMKEYAASIINTFDVNMKTLGPGHLKGNEDLNLTAEQLAFLFLSDPWGAKIYLTYKNDENLTKNVFRILYNREPNSYSLIDGTWTKTNKWTSSKTYSEADVYLTCKQAPLNLVQTVTIGLAAVTVYIGLAEIALFAQGVKAFGFYNALTAYSYGVLGSQLESWKVLTKLNNSEFISNYGIEHLFFGTVFKGKASGYHYEGIAANATIEAGTISQVDSYGVYQAKVTIDGISKRTNGGYSTFFPKNWTPQQVINAVKEAYTNKQLNQNSVNIYTGTTNSGMQIEMILDQNGLIKSAYPLFNP